MFKYNLMNLFDSLSCNTSTECRIPSNYNKTQSPKSEDSAKWPPEFWFLHVKPCWEAPCARLALTETEGQRIWKHWSHFPRLGVICESSALRRRRRVFQNHFWWSVARNGIPNQSREENKNMLAGGGIFVCNTFPSPSCSPAVCGSYSFRCSTETYIQQENTAGAALCTSQGMSSFSFLWANPPVYSRRWKGD